MGSHELWMTSSETPGWGTWSNGKRRNCLPNTWRQTGKREWRGETAILAGKGRATDVKEGETRTEGPNTGPGKVARKIGRRRPDTRAKGESQNGGFTSTKNKNQICFLRNATFAVLRERAPTSNHPSTAGAGGATHRIIARCCCPA